MRENMKKKLKKTGGFTLMEMLIVVAIIAILIAISIPIMNTALNNARVATDAANERAAKAAATITYLTEGVTTSTTYNYDLAKGELVPGTTTPDTYGKCSDHKGGYLQATIETNGTVTVAWSVSPDTLDSTSLTNN
jgi:type IV pilus assembly protein PilA